jgi:hypothetical protein
MSHSSGRPLLLLSALLPPEMSVPGSPLIPDNDFTLTASQMPPNEWG